MPGKCDRNRKEKNYGNGFSSIELREFVVMPNHVHGILELVTRALAMPPRMKWAPPRQVPIP